MEMRPRDYSCEKNDEACSSSKIPSEPSDSHKEYSEAPIVYQEPPIVVEGTAYPFAGKRRGTKKATICGIRRLTFILLACIVILLIIAGTAGGLAATYAAHQRAKDRKASDITDGSSTSGSEVSSIASTMDTSLSVAPTSSTSSLRAKPSLQAISSSAALTSVLSSGQLSLTLTTTLITPSETSTTSATSPTSTGPGGVYVECPSANGSYYTPPSYSSQKFLKLCANENPPEDGSIDITSVVAQSMEECMDQCARYNSDNGAKKCVGVNWIYRKAQGTDNSFCWLKGKVGGVEFWDGCEAGMLVE